MTGNVVVITGGYTGVGRLAAQALALAGHRVYVAVTDPIGAHAAEAEQVGYFARDYGVELRVAAMDTHLPSSVDAALQKVFDANGRIDTVVFIGAEDAAVELVVTAVLPQLRDSGRGLLVRLRHGSPSAAVHHGRHALAHWSVESTVIGSAHPVTDDHFARISEAIVDVILESIGRPAGQRPNAVLVDPVDGSD